MNIESPTLLPPPELEITAKASEMTPREQEFTRIQKAPSERALTPEQEAQRDQAWEEGKRMERTEPMDLYQTEPMKSMSDEQKTMILHDDLRSAELDGYQAVRDLKKAYDEARQHLSEEMRNAPRATADEIKTGEMDYVTRAQETATQESTATYPNAMVQTPLEQAVEQTGKDSEITAVGSIAEIQHDIDTLLPKTELLSSHPLPETTHEEIIQNPGTTNEIVSVGSLEEVKRDSQELLPLIELRTPEPLVMPVSQTIIQPPVVQTEAPPPPMTQEAETTTPKGSVLKRLLGIFHGNKPVPTQEQKASILVTPTLTGEALVQQSANDIEATLKAHEVAQVRTPVTVNS